ncbi:single Ig IL-1-related receptor isoform X3 [Oryx dammah]|nr:single Ig IL-1-related receptor isoform X3 [Oryx dammah]
MAGACDKAPDFLSPSGNQVLGLALGSTVTLNCTALVVSGPHCPLPSVQWLKDGLLLSNGSLYHLHEDSWVKTNWSEVLVSSVLGINLTRAEDFGTFTCSLQNVSSSSFTLWRAGLAGHVAAVLASLLALLALLLVALLYVKCRLNVLLWYQDKYGEVEMNDGKLYDAYISYSDSPEDRKFVNFILKPQLERHRGYKLFLDDRDLLPRAGTGAPALSAWAPPPLGHRSRLPRPRPSQGPAPSSPSPLSLGPALPRCTPRPRWVTGPAFPGPAPPRLGLRPLPGPRPSRAQSVLPPLMPGSCRAVGRPPGEPEPLPATCGGVVGCLPGPGLVQSQLPGGPVPAAGAHAQTHLHHLRGPAARPRAPRAAPAAPASPPGDPAALEARLCDAFLRFLERATVGAATEGAVQINGGRPPDPAAGRQGPHADCARPAPRGSHPGPRAGPRP